ncbi:putative PA14 domain protein [Fusarium austroafricanum]|uniref:Putative PA14 domain protein n=1 Tax=Fusarium austroafricanum TaxID=2364996 RepID=A0A8H4JSR6_9HYPO|nr:putative PA14 domain protein [Fusarium austroafricanum]
MSQQEFPLMEQKVSPQDEDILSSVLQAILPEGDIQKSALATLREFHSFKSAVQSAVPVVEQDVADRLELAATLFEITDGNGQLVLQIAKEDRVSTLQQFTTRYYTTPEDKDILSLTEDQRSLLKARLHELEPTGAIYNLVARGVIVAKDCTQAEVKRIFDIALSKGFNYRKDNVKSLVAHVHDTRESGPEFTKVIDFIKNIQRLQALVDDPEDIARLLNSALSLKSAQQVAEVPLPAFTEEMKRMGLAEAKIRPIHSRASIIATRNEMAWAAILKSRTENAVAAVRADPPPSDGASKDKQGGKTGDKASSLQDNRANAINYGNIFNEIDAAQCDDCCSILSPSAYFVDLLHRLETVKVNCTLKPPPKIIKIKTMYDQIVARRPDLIGLKLSCANTNTPIKYIDLINEVLESFIALTIDRKSEAVKIKTYDEVTSGSCAGSKMASAVPQNVNMDAYKSIAKKMVAPMHTFPYNHAIDTVRCLLVSKGQSRAELLETMRPYMPSRQGSLYTLNAPVGSTCARAIAAEYLNLHAANSMLKLTQSKYQELAGLRTTADYWGFETDNEMLDISSGKGLSNIAQQLLSRSGLSLVELIAILKTNFMGGRLIITPKDGMNKHSDQLKDMILRSSALVDAKGALNVDLCHDLQAFIRLQRLTGIPTEILDATMSCLARNGAPQSGGIAGSMIEGLASVKKLAKLVKRDIDVILPLWGDISTNSDNSLYHQLFLKQLLSISTSPFRQDEDGRYLAPENSPSLLDQCSVLSSAFGIDTNDLDLIVGLANIKMNDKLSLQNISSCYRISLVCRILEIEPENYAKFCAALPRDVNLYESPQTTLSVISMWTTLKSAGWTSTELLELFSPSADDTTPRYHATAIKVVQSLVKKTFLNGPSAGHDSTKLSDENAAYDIIKATFPELSSDMFIQALADAPIVKSSKWPANITNIFKVVPTMSASEAVVSDYFSAPTSGAYTFHIVRSSKEPPFLHVDDKPVSLQPSHNGKVWSSDEVQLSENQLCKLEASISKKELAWTGPDGSLKPFPESAIPGEAVLLIERAYESLLKISQLAKRYELAIGEIKDLLSTSGSAILPSFDINQLALSDALKLQQYKDIRKSTAKGHPGPLDFLRWARTKGRAGSVSDQTSVSLGWTASKVKAIFDSKHPKETEEKLAEIYSNIDQLAALREIVDFVGKPGLGNTSVDQLFALARPHTLDTTLETVFEDAVSFRDASIPTSASGATDSSNSALSVPFDTLREHRRTVLVNYLLNQDFFINKQFVDEDNLFEFFWIDVKMGATLETSRIKKAISSIHLFVQRSLMGMEPGYAIDPTYVPTFQKEWVTLSKYGLWEANRRVFLFPENWVDPTPRDNKTELFKEFESAISRKDISLASISEAIRNYIYGVNTVANLDVQAYLWERGASNGGNFHFFARTRTSPYQLCYRQLQVIDFGEKFPRWQPWEKVDLSIQPFEADSTGKTVDNPGSYLIPVIIRGRLYLFVPQLERKVSPNTTPIVNVDELAKKAPSQLTNSEQHWDIKMAWSEYRNGKWSPAVSSPAFLRVDKSNTGGTLPEASQFHFRVRSRGLSTTSGTNEFSDATFGEGIKGVLIVDVDAWTGEVSEASSSYTSYPVGRFEMNEMHFRATTTPGTTSPMTLPTSFSKLSYTVKSTAVVPTYTVTSPSGHDSALFVNAGKGDASKVCWTVAFDDSQFPRPTALVMDVQSTSGGNITYFARPADSLKDDTKSEESKGAAFFDRFNYPVSPQLVDVASAGSDLEAVYKTVNGLLRGTEGEEVNQSEAEIFASTFGLYLDRIYHEEITSYSMYTWELGVHIVSLLMETLQATQQYDLALDIARLTFDPSVHGTETNRCWKFAPFKDTTRIGVTPIKVLLQTLESGESTKKTMTDVAIYNWRQRPFDPHAIARGRPVTYMKRIIMKYIEILIDAGDVYFRQNTLESIPLALQRYIEASHLFGPRAQKVPKLGTRTTKSYIGLKRALNSFSNASLDMELEFPFSVIAGAGSSQSSGLVGILNTTYFCVPQNPKLLELIDLIDDRLFKIRNGRDINGNEQKLALFEPPMDPGALVAAAARGGLSASLLMADADSPMPNYRFQYLLQRALELCNEIKSIESNFLSAKEKKDAEAFSALKSQQDIALQTALAEAKTLQKDEAVISLAAQQEIRNSHVGRLRFYLALTGEKKKIPGHDEEWVDIEQNFGAITKGSLRMNTFEKEEMKKSDSAAEKSLYASTLEGAGSILRLLPQATIHTSPFGVGPAMKIDSYNIADSLKGASTVVQLLAQVAGNEASQAGRKAQMTRQLQERRFQANQAGRDIKSTDKQIAAAQTRIKITEAEIKQQALTIKQVTEADQWLRSKYTNEQLYAWMENSIRSTAYETYKLAAQFAKQVEKTYLFDNVSLASSRYLRPEGYWDNGRGGIGAAQALYLDLKKMEAAYIQNSAHQFEIVKSISLRQINPMALLDLRDEGICTFSVPEILFDMDFPGHYMRRIKAVSITVPCIFGAHTSLNCTLTMLSHKYRVSPRAAVGEYSEKPTSDDRFRNNPIPVKSVAISSGMQDAGLFELNFKDERYLPFEGAGVISEWKMELPTVMRQFDYNSITDVVLNVRYTSRAEPTLKPAAEDAVKKLLEASQNGQNFFAYFDIVDDFSNEWYSSVVRSGGSGKILMKDMTSRMPFWARDKRRKIVAHKIYVVTDAALQELTITPSEGTSETITSQGKFHAESDLFLVRADSVNLTVSDWTLSFSQELAQAAKKFYMVIEYSLGKA